MDYVIAAAASQGETIDAAADDLARALWSLGGMAISLLRTGPVLEVPATPQGSGPPVLLAAMLVNTQRPLAHVFDAVSRVNASVRGGQDLRLVVLTDVPGSCQPDELTARRAAAGETAADRVLPRPGLSADVGALIALQHLVPDWIDPISGRSVTQLLTALDPGLRNAVSEAGRPVQQRRVAE